MPSHKKGCLQRTAVKQCLQFDETGQRWCVEVYGKRFYFGRSNYQTMDAAKIAAMAFIDTLPQKAL